MKISYNWLKEYLELDLPAEELGEILTNIGLEVEGIQHFESVPGSLAGVVVGEVMSCAKHPNADKLSVTTVEYGDGPKQIVCGAPNVAAGQKVLVATVNSTLHPIESEPFKIKKAKIRGEESFGMICAEDELGLGTSHDGIMILDESIEVGTPAKDVFNIETDIIFDIGLTPNRSDATSHIGVAKDLWAYLKVNENYNKKLRLPVVDNFQGTLNKPDIEIELEDEQGCPRYSGLTISDIQVKESPDWLKNRLLAIGVRPINNIVDSTNFVLHEMGQPLHAFNLEAITGKKIIVKTLPGGTKFVSLDGEERTLFENDLMICDGDSNGMCIAGVFGGEKSGVQESTTEIFLESAHFNAKRIRVTSMKHMLRTDAAMCFEKGSDPNIGVIALKRAALLITELSGGRISSPLLDIYPKKIEPKKIDVRYNRINELIGIELEKSQIRDILNALEIEINSVSDQKLKVAIPTNKVDVTREIDVIEEILRIYGFNRIETDNQISYTFRTEKHPTKNSLYNRVSDYLSSNGFFECMSISLDQSADYEDSTQDVLSGLVYINNTSNVYLDIMRPSMIPSMLDNVRHNQNRQNYGLKLFEFGKTYSQKGEGIFNEPEHLTFALSGPKNYDHWLTPNGESHSFYSLKAMTMNILQLLGLDAELETTDLSEHPYLSEGLSLIHNKQNIGDIGIVRSSLLESKEVKNDVFVTDLNWGVLNELVENHRTDTAEISRFPSVRRDLALEIDTFITYQSILDCVYDSGARWVTDIGLFDVFSNKDLDSKGKKSYAIYLIFQHAEKTLQDKDVDKEIEKILAKLKDQLNVSLR